jgi:hypothetical protein
LTTELAGQIRPTEINALISEWKPLPILACKQIAAVSQSYDGKGKAADRPQYASTRATSRQCRRFATTTAAWSESATSRGDLMQFDDNHLSAAGSKFFVKAIASQILDQCLDLLKA